MTAAEKEERVRLAERKLCEAVNRGEEWAIRYVLELADEERKMRRGSYRPVCAKEPVPE